MKLQRYVLAGVLLAGAFVGQALAAGDRTENAGASYFTSHTAINQTVLEDNYARCLSSNTDGVVESALAYVIQMKLEWPDQNFSKIEKAARKLSVNGRTLAIRYKASLASIVYDDMLMQQLTDCVNCDTPDELFAKVSARVQQAALGEDR
jgi:hypothetical protein